MEDMMQALHQMKHKLYDLADAVGEVMAELSDIEKDIIKCHNCNNDKFLIVTNGEHVKPYVCFDCYFNKQKKDCNCKHKGECYKTLGEHGYKVTNCKGLVE